MAPKKRSRERSRDKKERQTGQEKNNIWINKDK